MEAPSPTRDTHELIDLRKELRKRTLDLWSDGQQEQALEARDEIVKEGYQVLYRSLDSARKASAYLEVSAELLQLAGRDQLALEDLFEATYLINSHEVPPADLGRLNGALATLLDKLGRSQEARLHYERSIEYFGKIDGAPIGVARVKNNLAMLEKFEGQPDLAEQHYREALEIVNEKDGEDDELAASVRYNLAVLLQEADEDAEAAELFEESLAIRQRVLGDEHVDTGASHAAVALVHALMGENSEALSHFAVAEPVMRNNVSVVREEYEGLSENYAIFLRNIGLNERAAEVEEVAEKALASLAS